MNKDKSKLQLIGEIAQANNKNLELIEEINNLQSKIDKVVELNNKIINSTEEKVKINCDDKYGYTRILAGLINDILEEEKNETNN